jgi:hypothetical protein
MKTINGIFIPQEDLDNGKIYVVDCEKIKNQMLKCAEEENISIEEVKEKYQNLFDWIRDMDIEPRVFKLLDEEKQCSKENGVI